MSRVTFGAWLRETRASRRMSLRDVARVADVSPTYLSSLERNEPVGADGQSPRPSERVVRSIAMALGTDTGEALAVAGYRVEASDPDPDMLRLAKLLGSVATEQRRRIIDAVEVLVR